MATKKVKLTHVSNVKGAEGTPGDIVIVDATIADRWIDAGGAVEIAESRESRVKSLKEPEKKADDKKADDKKAEK